MIFSHKPKSFASFNIHFRYKLFRFYPSDGIASKLIFSTFEENEGTEVWSMRDQEIDVMVTREKMDEFEELTTILHTPFNLLVDDIER